MKAVVASIEPVRDEAGHVTEAAEEYARRMRAGPLPGWPAEVLRDWLHPNAGFLNKYACLEFESFHFKLEEWPLSRVPGRDAFDFPEFCDVFAAGFEERVRDGRDWLAAHMLNAGTWNQPVILLRNPAGKHVLANGHPLKQPFHLLDGHRRVSFLVALRQLGKAKPRHKVWVVSK